MASLTLYREDMDEAGRIAPGCDDAHPLLKMSAPCHPGVEIETFYDPSTGTAVICCQACRRVLCRLAIADRPAVVRLQ
jgi:hypothetical protein